MYMNLDYNSSSLIRSKSLGPIFNNNVIRTTKEDKIFNIDEFKPTVMPQIKPQYIYIGIASIIIIILINNK